MFISCYLFIFIFQIEHLYGLTVFENYLYATNSDNANMQPKTSVIRVNRFNSTDYQVVTRVDKGGALHVYHQRRQPPGARAHTHSRTRLHSPHAVYPVPYFCFGDFISPFVLVSSAKPRLWGGPVWKTWGLLRHLSSGERTQDPDLPLPLWI